MLKFRSACEIFSKKQRPDETAEAYVTRLCILSKKADVDDKALLYALLSGLKSPISSYVLGKNPQSLADAVDAERLAEFSVGESSNDQQVCAQLIEMRKDIHKYENVPRRAVAYQASPSHCFPGFGESSCWPSYANRNSGAASTYLTPAAAMCSYQPMGASTTVSSCGPSWGETPVYAVVAEANHALDPTQYQAVATATSSSAIVAVYV